MKGNTALHEACHNGKLDVLKTLLDAGSDVKATTNEGETPLHIGVCQRERGLGTRERRRSVAPCTVNPANTRLSVRLRSLCKALHAPMHAAPCRVIHAAYTYAHLDRTEVCACILRTHVY